MIEMIRKTGFRYLAAGKEVPKANLIQRFLDKNFLIKILRQLEIDCVLDVGANRGQYAEGLRAIGYEGEIHSFEPIPEDFETLKAASTGDPKWFVYNWALGREPGTAEFNRVDGGGENSQFSSFLTPNHEMIPASVTKIPVEVRTLDSLGKAIPALEDPHRRIYLKLDTQGFDMEVCAGGTATLGTVMGLQSELSVKQIYANQPAYIDALQFYQDLGFSLMDLTIVNRTPQNAVLEYDCIMARVP